MRRAASLALLLFAAVLPACGDDDAGGPDLTNPQEVFLASLRAVHDGDWPQLERLLTKDARHALESDMRRLKKNLAARDKNLMRVVTQQLGDDADASVGTAVGGGMREMLMFFVKLSPREREPQQRGMRLDPKTQSTQFTYVIANGEERVVTLVQARGRWYVSNLQL